MNFQKEFLEGIFRRNEFFQNEFALFSAPRMMANACMDGISAKQLIQVRNEHGSWILFQISDIDQ